MKMARAKQMTVGSAASTASRWLRHLTVMSGVEATC